jgi:hypothetical protein
MKVHVIYDPNRRGGSEVRVHRAGCRDIQRDIRPNPHSRHGATSHYETAGSSQREIAEDFYADFIEEESMTAAQAMDYTEFLPCTAGLPVEPAEEVQQ